MFKNIKKKVAADRTDLYACNYNRSPQPKRVFVLLSGVVSPLHCSHQEKTKKKWTNSRDARTKNVQFTVPLSLKEQYLYRAILALLLII